MPELPEVETVANQLHPVLKGVTLKRLEILDDLLKPLQTKKVAGKTISRVFRFGKEIVFKLVSPKNKAQKPIWLSVHLRMTGRLIWHPHQQQVDKKHLRAKFHLEKGQLLFYDTRRFGVIRILENLNILAGGGVDPTDASFDWKMLSRMLGGSKQAIKVWLLRQDKLVGLGNIYASEILYRAGINPYRPAGSMSKPEIKKLHRAIRSVLAEAIKSCGTTFRDFQDSTGSIGSYQNCLKVYGKKGELCPKCKDEIASEKQQGRSTYYCPSCQEK
jgi:formamidopyrimidine-DNA glycosylase